MKCPLCNIDLQMSEKQGIEIDYCTQCRGIWLDRGELDKIIERSASYDQEQRTPESQSRHLDSDDDDDSSYGRGRKKESLLGNLFDF